MTKPTENKSPDTSDAKPQPERIAKRIARAGVCSRREAETLIAEGRVRLNGKLLDTPATTVTPSDRIEVNGKLLPEPEQPRVWRYHKPDGLVTTNHDPQGRETIFDALPKDLPRVITVGRLDLTSEGLLLLTNDGEIARKLELPATGWSRKYRARVHGTVDPKQLAKLAKGHEVSGIKYGPIQAELERQVGANAWITVILREGKNREVRKVLESIGLTVNRLIRISYGPFQLGNLPVGAVEELAPNILADQMGIGTPSNKKGHAVAKVKPKRSHRPKPKSESSNDKPGKEGKFAKSDAKHRGKGNDHPGKHSPGKHVPNKTGPGKAGAGRPATGKTGKPGGRAGKPSARPHKSGNRQGAGRK